MGHSTNGRWGVDTIHKNIQQDVSIVPVASTCGCAPKNTSKMIKRRGQETKDKKDTSRAKRRRNKLQVRRPRALAHAVPPAPTMTTCACLSTTTTTTALPFEAVVLLQSHWCLPGAVGLRNAFDGSSSPQPVLHPRRLLQPQA